MSNLTLNATESKFQWCWLPQNYSQGQQNLLTLTSNTWVNLLESFNPFCYDQALLLCPESELKWRVWIPDHGEAVININQFCLEPTVIAN